MTAAYYTRTNTLISFGIVALAILVALGIRALVRYRRRQSEPWRTPQSRFEIFDWNKYE